MAVQAKYTQPLQVVATPEQRARVKRIADREGISQAQVIRDLIDTGLPAREHASVERHGAHLIKGSA